MLHFKTPSRPNPLKKAKNFTLILPSFYLYNVFFLVETKRGAAEAVGVGVDPVGVAEEVALEEEVDLVEDAALVAVGVEEEVLPEAEEDLEVVVAVDSGAGVEAKILYNVKLHSAYYTINTFKYTMNTCLYYSNTICERLINALCLI